MLPRTESTVLRNEERIAERDDRKQTGLARQTTVWPPGDGPGMCFTMICCFAPHKFGRGRFWSWLCDNALVRCVFFRPHTTGISPSQWWKPATRAIATFLGWLLSESRQRTRMCWEARLLDRGAAINAQL